MSSKLEFVKLAIQGNAPFSQLCARFGISRKTGYKLLNRNGAPWGPIQRPDRYTALSLWLIRLGIHVSFSKIRRPQTNGKIERFHLTLKKELLAFNYFWNLKDAQKNFDIWREKLAHINLLSFQ